VHTHTCSIHSFSHAREEGREKAVEFINGGEEVEKEGEALDLSTKTHKPLVTHTRRVNKVLIWIQINPRKRVYGRLGKRLGNGYSGVEAAGSE
jgi:hypothetical protein